MSVGVVDQIGEEWHYSIWNKIIILILFIILKIID